jgi:plastocyanin
MRKAVLVAVAVLVASVAPGVSAVASGPPIPTDLSHACQPDPTISGPQTLHCQYGPLTVTPGTNMILFGPVSIESPRADGYITRFAPNLVDATTGEVPPIHVVHLHHGVWLNAASGSTTPFFATGEEKTQAILPPGYGYRTRPTDAWVLNFMLHNLTEAAFTVYIQYDLDWVPASTPDMKEVVPVWLDAVGHKDATKQVYPVYDPAKDGSAYTTNFAADQDAELVWVGGHVHPGGLRDELRSVTCGSQLLFSSDATMNNGDASFGSWDYRMTVSHADWRFTVRRGEQLSVSGYYDNTHPWYEAMAIMVAWARPLTPAELATRPPCTLPTSTTGDVTPGPEPPNPSPVYGGDNESPRSPTNPSSTTTQVAIAGFTYSPGGGKAQPAGVLAGSSVTFTNYDAGASIFHTVTACASPCNGDTGQKYPLSEWPAAGNVGDSGQLGFGPPLATAAVQRATYAWTVPAGAQAGDLFTFYCRIHPDMRGSLEVVG